MKSHIYQRYFDEILSKANTTNEKIYSILSARGFLLNLENNELTISDNSTRGDIENLEIIISGREGLNIKELEILSNGAFLLSEWDDLFTEKEEISFACISFERKWSYYKNRIYGESVNAMDLEPFIARYIKALSSIGIDTSMSCDGNHSGDIQSQSMKVSVTFNSKYDQIWHKIVSEFVLHQQNIWNYGKKNNVILYYNESTQLEKYLTILDDANQIYDNRLVLRELKNKTNKLAQIKQKNIDELTYDQAYDLLLSCVTT